MVRDLKVNWIWINYCEMRGIHVIRAVVGRIEEFRLIRWNLKEFSATGQASET